MSIKALIGCCSCLVLASCAGFQARTKAGKESPHLQTALLVYTYDVPYYEVFVAAYDQAHGRIEPKRQMGSSKSPEEVVCLLEQAFSEVPGVKMIFIHDSSFSRCCFLEFPKDVDGVPVEPLPDGVAVYREFHVR